MVINYVLRIKPKETLLPFFIISNGRKQHFKTTSTPIVETLNSIKIIHHRKFVFHLIEQNSDTDVKLTFICHQIITPWKSCVSFRFECMYMPTRKTHRCFVVLRLKPSSKEWKTSLYLHPVRAVNTIGRQQRHKGPKKKAKPERKQTEPCQSLFLKAGTKKRPLLPFITPQKETPFPKTTAHEIHTLSSPLRMRQS